MFRKRDQPRLWRATFAVVGWTALALQYLLMVAPVISTAASTIDSEAGTRSAWFS